MTDDYVEQEKARKPDGWRPVKYGRDGTRITLGEIVQAVADKLDADDVDSACDQLDELFIFGCWGHALAGRNAWDDACKQLLLLRKDIRGLVIDAYEEGKRRGAKDG